MIDNVQLKILKFQKFHFVNENVTTTLLVKMQNTKKYGSDTLRALGPKIWNKLPINIKETTNLDIFKKLIKTWSGPECSCGHCASL